MDQSYRYEKFESGPKTQKFTSQIATLAHFQNFQICIFDPFEIDLFEEK